MNVMILMSPHPHPSKALQGDRREKLQLPASCRKNAEKTFSTIDHYQTRSKRETSSSIGVKFILSFKTFLRSPLKIKTYFLYFIASLL